ncbi:MAG: hypothetical protein ACR2MZ_02070 [Candidatus Dormibacter sp.]|uniref:hypothetical protein n=1 Tax=Candidatus Dormibacter sp. TaxID=2973982 RepID=UPI000DB28464|nr:MAG: hypothetical protein DLM66_08365 [Candidatus Dormibacteraeota bacterium]
MFIVLASPAAAIAEVLLVRRSGLAPLCGAVRGSAHRLHAASQPAAGFLVMANRWAMLAGCLLLAAAAITVSSSGLEIADGLEDAAQHAIGLGLVTTLIVGMARLLTPVFAIGRTQASPSVLLIRLIWLGLSVATALRVLAAVIRTMLPLAGGICCSRSPAYWPWPALALFTTSFILAWRRQGKVTRELRSSALARRR